MNGDLTPALIDTDVWTDEMVAAAGIPIVDVPFVTVGGGIGSFVTVDYLRIAGVPAAQSAALGPPDHPWPTYEYLDPCLSDPPRRTAPLRLRLDARTTSGASRRYAVREAFSARSLSGFVKPLWNVADRADLRELLHAARPGRPSSRWNARPAGSRYAEMVRQGPGADGARRSAAATSPSSRRRPRAPPTTSGSRTAARTCTSPSATPA